MQYCFNICCYVKAQDRDLATKFYHISKLNDLGSGIFLLGKDWLDERSDH